VGENKLKQEAACMPCCLTPMPEQWLLLELSRGEGGSPEPGWAGGNSVSRFCSPGVGEEGKQQTWPGHHRSS